MQRMHNRQNVGKVLLRPDNDVDEKDNNKPTEQVQGEKQEQVQGEKQEEEQENTE